MSKECPKPKDWSRVQCSNCKEYGLVYLKGNRLLYLADNVKAIPRFGAKPHQLKKRWAAQAVGIPLRMLEQPRVDGTAWVTQEQLVVRPPATGLTTPLAAVAMVSGATRVQVLAGKVSRSLYLYLCP